jgi:hypothetical protein
MKPNTHHVSNNPSRFGIALLAEAFCGLSPAGNALGSARLHRARDHAKTKVGRPDKGPLKNLPEPIEQMTFWTFQECAWCQEPLPLSSSPTRRTCSRSCRSKLSRANLARAAEKPPQQKQQKPIEKTTNGKSNKSNSILAGKQ